MNNAQAQTAPIKTRVIATVTQVQPVRNASDDDTCTMTFQDSAGNTYVKVLKESGMGLDRVFAALGIKRWADLGKTVKTLVQLVLLDGKTAYINQVDQDTGKVVYTPMTAVDPRIAALHAIPAATPLPLNSKNPEHVTFPDHCKEQQDQAEKDSTFNKIVEQSRIQELYSELPSDDQHRVLIMVNALVAANASTKR